MMHAFSGSKIFSEFIIDGGYYPEGGIQNLPNTLVKILEQDRGKIIYKRSVKKIILSNRSVTGVELGNNETFNSNYVVSACDMTQTFETFIGERIIGAQICEKLRNMIPSLSTFILYLGIDKHFEGLPEPGTNIWFLPHYDLSSIYNQIQECNFKKVGYMLRVSPDSRTILSFFGAPFITSSFWKQNKKKIAEDFLDRVEQTIPNIKKHITYFDAATPSTLYRFTHNYKGAAFGWAKTPSQTFESFFSRTSPIKGLYLTGHWTSIAFGMPGTCYSGADTARRIMRNAKSL